MLHPVPDSSLRRRLLRVVALQRRLVLRLCELPQGANVDQYWLEGVWHDIHPEWVGAFWANDKENRKDCIETLAAAPAADKLLLAEVCREQLRFRLLWEQGGSLSLRKVEWNKKQAVVFSAAGKLLRSFYAPLFYDKGGYRFPCGDLAKSAFLAGIPSAALKVCPYCDNYLQTTELDHFLPKDLFPFLSCHPDNLIPSCHDSNRGSHKGTIPPLDWDAQDQALGWFQPRWRSASGRVEVRIEETTASLLSTRLVPRDPTDAIRVKNLDGLFKLSQFWSGQIADELQLIGSQVASMLQHEDTEPNEERVASMLRLLADLKAREIGKRGLALCHSSLYRFAADTPSVVTDILRQCRDQLDYQLDRAR